MEKTKISNGLEKRKRKRKTNEVFGASMMKLSAPPEKY
jgi:hypothetical protein